MNDEKGRFYARVKRCRHFRETVAVLGLIGLFFLVQWLVNTFQKPGHMGVLESQTMEMAIQPPEGAMPVQTEVVQPRPFVTAVTYTGSAVAYNDIVIYPRVEGRIVSMPVYPGDRVQAGQLLAQLDTRELSSRVAETQAAQATAIQQYYASIHQQGQASAQAQRTQQAIGAARANLQFRQAQVERSRSLVVEDVITREEAQRDEADYTNALSQFQQAQAELRATQQGASAAAFQTRAQRNQARQAVAAARTQSIIRSYTRITAPQNGVITQRMVSPGTLVGLGMPILQVSQLNPIRIQANVAESDLTSIRLGNRVSIRDRKNRAGIVATGRVTSIFPKAELQTRTAIVEAVIGNSGERFIPGDFVTVSIQTGTQGNVLAVPSSALIEQGGQQAIWTVENGKAHLQFVTTGGSNGSRTAIVNGLKAGDTIITQGNQNLVEEALVAQGEYGEQGLKALPKAVSTSRLTQANQYRVKRTVSMYLATIALQDKPARLGKNTLLVELASGPGMSMPIGKLSIALTAHMSSMSTMPVPKPGVQKTGDGRFKVDAMLGMPGFWQIMVTVKDGSQTIAVFPVEIEVPQ